MTVDPLEVVNAFGAAWAAHDLDAALSMCTHDCLFESTGPAPDGTPYIGIEAVRVAWKPIFDDKSSSFEEEETFAAGDRVVQRWCYRWSSGSVRGVDVFRIHDGKVAEKISYVKG